LTAQVPFDIVRSTDRLLIEHQPQGVRTLPSAADETRVQLLRAGEDVLAEHGYAGLSTRRVADAARVPLSQIHYHFGSKTGLLLAVFEHQNQRLLERQTEMFGSDMPLWKQWEQACDYFDDDLASGYVHILQEMIAAGWTDEAIAGDVRRQLGHWYGLLTSVVAEAASRIGGLGPFTPDELAALVGNAFLGAEQTILLGMAEKDLPSRSALRKVGALIRMLEEAA
jgi:AcrR family transcriptional regulator